MKNRILLVLCAMMLWGTHVSAIELKIMEDEDLTDHNQYEEDYLFMGRNLNFQGKARDLFFFANKLHFSGISKLGITGGAQNIYISGEINNGVKAAGQKVIIDANIKGTSFLAGDTVNISKGSQIIGDTFIGARKVTLLGRNTGRFRVGAAEVLIQNVVQGDADIYAGQLKIGEQGRIIGNLNYHSDHELSKEEASRVTGHIKFEQNDEEFFDDDLQKQFFSASVGFIAIYKLAFMVLGLLLLILPVNKFLERRYTRQEILSNSLWGLIPIFVYPTVFVVSILLLITIPLAVLMLLSFMPLIIITKTLGITIIGSFLVEKFKLNITSRYLYFLIGAILYSILSLIPFFGFVLLVFVSSIGCGLLLSLIINKNLV